MKSVANDRSNKEDTILDCFLESFSINFGKIEKEQAKLFINFFLREVVPNLLRSPSSLVKGYYRCAELDYQAAMLLSNDENYKNLIPLVIFHLQQAVEKLTKAYALYRGFIKKDELYGKSKDEVVGHYSPKAFTLLLKKMRERGATGLIDASFLMVPKKPTTTVKETLEKFEELLQQEKLKEMAKISREEISHLMKNYEIFESAVQRINIRETMKKIRKFRTGFISRLRDSAISPEVIEDIDRQLGIASENIHSILQELLTFSQLYSLAIVTFPHFFYSRYPDLENDGITFADYHEGLGIVDSLDKILTWVGSIMEKTKKIGRR
jgi:HEPN domain-containing protein